MRECPVSYITAESETLIRIMSVASRAKEAAGASLYGNDLSQWPAAAVDALVVIEGEEVALHNARLKADS